MEGQPAEVVADGFGPFGGVGYFPFGAARGHGRWCWGGVSRPGSARGRAGAVCFEVSGLAAVEAAVAEFVHSFRLASRALRKGVFAAPATTDFVVGGANHRPPLVAGRAGPPPGRVIHRHGFNVDGPCGYPLSWRLITALHAGYSRTG